MLVSCHAQETRLSPGYCHHQHALQMFKEACRGHRVRHRLHGEGIGKEAEAAACNWFMSELLPTYKDALDNIAAGRLSSVNLSESAKVAPTCVLCTAFQQDLWLSAPGSECCRQGTNNLQDMHTYVCAAGHLRHKISSHGMYAFKVGCVSIGSEMVYA